MLGEVMPIFELRCEPCDYNKDAFLAYKDKFEQYCERCGRQMTALMTSPVLYEIKGGNQGSTPSKYAKKFKDD